MNLLIRIIISIAVLFFFGCVIKADYLTPFTVTGKVCDKETNVPLKNADIVFVDKGFDYYRSTINYSYKVGNSGESGVIDKDFEYFWGTNKAWFYKKPTKLFEIVIKKDGFIDKDFIFVAGDLERIDRRVVVPLGIIFLERGT